MPDTPTTNQSIAIFRSIALEEFDYLRSDYGFTAREVIGAINCAIDYDLPTVAIGPCWNQRDGADVSIYAKVDTFWIRPASSHVFHILELLGIVAPEKLKDIPRIDPYRLSANTLRPWLRFYAQQLKIHAEPLLRGNVSLCEDMLIMRYCNTAKNISMDDYFEIFRRECSVLSPTDREQVDAALASRSPRQVWFTLIEIVYARKLLTPRFREAVNDFRNQFMH